MLNMKKFFLLKTVCLLCITSLTIGSQDERSNRAVLRPRGNGALSSLFSPQDGLSMIINRESKVSQGGFVSPLYQANCESPLYQICSSSQAAKTRSEFPKAVVNPLGDAVSVDEILVNCGQDLALYQIAIENPDNFFVTLESCNLYLWKGKAHGEQPCTEEEVSQERHWVTQKDAQISTKLSNFKVTIERLGEKDQMFTTKNLRLTSGDCHIFLSQYLDWIYFRAQGCVFE